MKCHYCDQAGDLRPYGPNGAPLCFDCMKASPEREAEAERQFSMQLEACGPVAVIGTEAGPAPMDGTKTLS